MAHLDTGTAQLLCAIDDAVATITLNRPEKRNALSDELTPALRETLLALERDDAVRCIVVTGTGNACCAGGDVSGMGRNDGARSRRANPEAAITELRHREETLALRLFELAKPTIAALPGPAAGAGLSIALACDLRIAAASAFIKTAFATIGLPGDYGGSWFLTQLVGPAKAKELYFLSPRVDAARCLELGIVNEVVPDDELPARARELARTVAAAPPIAVAYMKAHINGAVAGTLRECLAAEAEHTVRCAQTADHREAVSAFLEKRTPRFSGN